MFFAILLNVFHGIGSLKCNYIAPKKMLCAKKVKCRELYKAKDSNFSLLAPVGVKIK